MSNNEYSNDFEVNNNNNNNNNNARSYFKVNKRPALTIKNNNSHTAKPVSIVNTNKTAKKPRAAPRSQAKILENELAKRNAKAAKEEDKKLIADLKAELIRIRGIKPSSLKVSGAEAGKRRTDAEMIRNLQRNLETETRKRSTRNNVASAASTATSTMKKSKKTAEERVANAEAKVLKAKEKAEAAIAAAEKAAEAVKRVVKSNNATLKVSLKKKTENQIRANLAKAKEAEADKKAAKAEKNAAKAEKAAKKAKKNANKTLKMVAATLRNNNNNSVNVNRV